MDIDIRPEYKKQNGFLNVILKCINFTPFITIILPLSIKKHLIHLLYTYVSVPRSYLVSSLDCDDLDEQANFIKQIIINQNRFLFTQHQVKFT